MAISEYDNPDFSGNMQKWPAAGRDCPVRKQHHTLTQILMGLLHTGFTLQAVEEAHGYGG